MIAVTIDDEATDLDASTTLADIARDLDRTPLAIAHNGRVVMRPAWAATVLSDGDELRIIHAIGSG